QINRHDHPVSICKIGFEHSAPMQYSEESIRRRFQIETRISNDFQKNPPKDFFSSAEKGRVQARVRRANFRYVWSYSLHFRCPAFAPQLHRDHG
ncbi:MAG TPA: hypothetical protein VLA12_23175, partial [Planctomycetaceae bacterium]|nr:hypothetical protein [Planctomycetaceae bacterium]